MGLVARCGAAVPEDVVDGGGGRVAVGGDQQLDRVQRAGADLDLLGRVVLDQLLGVDAGDQIGIELEHAVDAQDVWHEVVGEQRERTEIAGGRDAGQREVGGGDLGTLVQRYLE